jgi:8-oxo-dGTP diphosphatase
MAGKPELCVGAIVTHNGCLLLVQRGTEPGKGLWSVPGGRVEFGETMAEAVVREVAEETALAVAVTSVVGWVERLSPEYHFVIVDFAAALVGPDAPVAGDDAAAVTWVPIADVAQLPLVTGLLDFLRKHNVVAASDPSRPVDAFQ